MEKGTRLLQIVPVLPSADIAGDIAWYREKTGFEPFFQDEMYAGLRRENLHIHLQWHAGTPEDPLLGGSVIRIFVEDIRSIFEEFVERGAVSREKLRMNTPWRTHEFGFFDLNHNAVFIVENAE
ncbi:MAG TPA: glyoxalase/bleomycin resistance/extradiol dioxygenase family protein [Flavilitoribacter sp.]|nr:glyoxalase/bleomycin resistance/extradiol dioxygenase family protein [Flavilitoribacter sp.]HMQ89247.1 glyoxalase/bleomycin resistance/extradiol dioxygenase family protein [Flavilitoribacter sp.]